MTGGLMNLVAYGSFIIIQWKSQKDIFSKLRIKNILILDYNDLE